MISRAKVLELIDERINWLIDYRKRCIENEWYESVVDLDLSVREGKYLKQKISELANE